MYFVDRERIGKTLDYMEDLVNFVETLKLKDKLERLALERSIHMVIESILDVGNAMIDGFIMRDPGSYEDIIDILEDEKVINDKDAGALKEVIGFRKTLVQDYLTIDHLELAGVFRKNRGEISNFPSKVKRYLDEELGPVSAFKN
jgi:uncharacterized protein YutE (UPF0331/DUF86 family)